MAEHKIPPLTFISISAAVCLVVSSFSTSRLSPRKLLSAADSLVRSSSSRSLSSILNVFCCLVSSLCRDLNPRYWEKDSRKLPDYGEKEDLDYTL